MKLRTCFQLLCLGIPFLFSLAGCEHKGTSYTDFTKADSVTETYLALQDTMLQVWNTMIHDDNRKIRAMRHLLHELSVSNPDKLEELERYEERLDDLQGMRYDQHSISESELVTAYDFSSNALVSELIALAESQREFSYNTTLQKLVDAIRAADQRVNIYRQEYDDVASRFNHFVDRNRSSLEEIEDDSTVLKRPLFQMAVE